MVLYFSGTGNSEYAAKQIAAYIKDDAINLFNKIKNNDYEPLTSTQPWVVVVPTYAWRIPHIVRDWMIKTRLNGNRDIYFVMTCGGENGNAGAYLKKLCDEKKMRYMGCASIVMPENYIALFTPPDKKEAASIIEKANKQLPKIAALIKNGCMMPQIKITLKDKISSGVVNDVFYALFVHSKKFIVTDECISCGKCESLCPLKNISIKNGQPLWGDNCTHCMACIAKCPKEAIEYGRRTKDLVRYVFPNEMYL